MKDQEKVHEIRLKPCPFCSGRAKIEEVTIKKLFLRATGYFITCRSCRAHTGAQLKIDAAIEAWNRRTDARQKERWIPVSEGLPEDGKRVLATHEGGLNPNRQVIEHYFHNGQFMNNWAMDTDVHSSTFGQRYMGDVLAWMPLPEPYKE